MTGLRSFLLLRPADQRVADVVAYYRERRVIEAAVPYGVVEGELLHVRDDPADLLVTSVWSDAAGYAAWRTAPARAVLLEGLAPLLRRTGGTQAWTAPATAVPGEVYHPGTALVVAHHVGRSGAHGSSHGPGTPGAAAGRQAAPCDDAAPVRHSYWM
ncbi:hypothetical protein GTZ78_34990 [Streptomyces sp. SID8361]|uniref:hypothetical protein n=1 Tax=Streptomyces sp. MnatMP-M27 TaxID=1839768 RepID=UPI00081E6597|nr:hypothetical protein [Streptomyces sp. MnatMP-M27]MYU15742.1 hypothetical protein [Streptomyces sp. SID8361]SCG10207.1 hypothetical protein GA0115260_1107112 [Streptomyces sp. MnatMP-M27]